VQRQAVHEALQWLHKHNILYHDIEISQERLVLLPEDRIPESIEAVIRYEEDGSAAVREREGYAMEDPPVSDGKQLMLNVTPYCAADESSFRGGWYR